MFSAELDVILKQGFGLLLVHTNFENCLALRINLRISLLRFLLKDVKFIRSFFSVFQRS